jgi:hypothetical protein
MADGSGLISKITQLDARDQVISVYKENVIVGCLQSNGQRIIKRTPDRFSNDYPASPTVNRQN